MLNKLFPQNRLIKAEDLKKTWRIIVMLILGQMIGLVIGIVYPLHPDKFLSLWAGGATGTLPGFLLGLVWYFKKESLKNGIPYFTIIFFSIGALALPIAAYSLINEGKEFVELQKGLQNIDSTSPTKIVVYSNYRQNKLIELSDPLILEEFAKACKDIEGVHIQNNKPCRTIDRYYIDLNGALPKDIILDHCESDYATGSFAKSDGRVTTYHGDFSSKALKPWLEKVIKK